MEMTTLLAVVGDGSADAAVWVAVVSAIGAVGVALVSASGQRRSNRELNEHKKAVRETLGQANGQGTVVEMMERNLSISQRTFDVAQSAAMTATQARNEAKSAQDEARTAVDVTHQHTINAEIKFNHVASRFDKVMEHIEGIRSMLEKKDSTSA